MILDAQLQFSDAQALTASAASTNYIDFGLDRDMGVGEALAAVVTVGVAFGGTSPTLSVGIQTDDNTSFSSATTLVTSEVKADLVAGDQIVVPLPGTNERYMRLYYTMTGTSPTATVDGFLQPMSMVTNPRVYADAITIS